MKQAKEVVVLEYEIPPLDLFRFELPMESRLLAIQMNTERSRAFLIVSSTNLADKFEYRTFYLLRTGSFREIDFMDTHTLTYVGSFEIDLKCPFQRVSRDTHCNNLIDGVHLFERTRLA